jgi:hypothetical protein
VRLALAVCLLTAGCGRDVSGAGAATSTTTSTTTTTVPPTTRATTTTLPVLSGGYLNKASFGAIILRVTKTGVGELRGLRDLPVPAPRWPRKRSGHILGRDRWP